MDPPHNSSLTSTEITPENGVKAKKKRKERSKEEKNLIADSGNHMNDSFCWSYISYTQHLNWPLYDSLLHCSEEVSENSSKSKKRRKGAREGKSHEDNSTNLIKEDQAKQDEVKADGNMNMRNEQDKKPSSE